MDVTMMSLKVRAMTGVGAAAVALIGTAAVASMPLFGGLLFATVLFAGLGYVAFAAQSRRFDEDSRTVYRPVYVRSRSVQRRVRSFDD